MSDMLISKLESILAQLIGITCWGISVGGATGSRFNLHFGKKLERPRQLENVASGDDLRRFRGEFALLVGCASWRLDGHTEPVTACTDVAAPGGPMVLRLHQLRDSVVTAVGVTTPGLDLSVEFDKTYTLRVFCDQFDERFDNYSVRFGSTYVIVGARSHLSIEHGKPIHGA